jgi:hypothetical protein
MNLINFAHVGLSSELRCSGLSMTRCAYELSPRQCGAWARFGLAEISLVIRLVLIFGPPVWLVGLLGSYEFFHDLIDTDTFSAILACAVVYFCLAVQGALGLIQRKGVLYLHLLTLLLCAWIFFDIATQFLPILRKGVVVVSFSELAAPTLFGALFLLRSIWGNALARSIDKFRSCMIRTAADLSRRRKERPILLLRSFADDGQWLVNDDAIFWHLLGVFRRNVRLEEVVAGVMFAKAPFVALADPRSQHAALGAARDPASCDDWQELALDYMNQASLVVFVLGFTPSLAWEIDQIVRLGKIEQLLLVIPPETRDIRSILRDLPALSRALGLIDDNSERDMLTNVRAISFDSRISCFRAFATRQSDSAAYRWAIKSAAACAVAK